jgi:hypothetical protein
VKIRKDGEAPDPSSIAGTLEIEANASLDLTIGDVAARRDPRRPARGRRGRSSGRSSNAGPMTSLRLWPRQASTIWRA